MNWDAVFITLGAVSLATGGGGYSLYSDRSS